MSEPKHRAHAISIRPARPDEIDALWNLVGELARYERLEHFFTGTAQAMAHHLFGDGWPKVEAIVAEDRGALVGYAIYYAGYSTFWTRPLTWLEDLYVSDARRGEGIGRALLRTVARAALERGSPRLDWAVLDWNQPSIDFYERLGAVRQGGWHTYRLEGKALEDFAAAEERESRAE